MATFQRFLDGNRSKLMGYFLIGAVSEDSDILATPYPPAVLSEEQLDVLRDRLRACMPLSTMITDLWDRDVHFEDVLSDDWYFEAVFGDDSSLDSSSEELAEFFLEMCDKYDMDYNQSDDDLDFRALIRDEAEKFITGWRQEVMARHTGQSAAEETPHLAPP